MTSIDDQKFLRGLGERVRQARIVKGWTQAEFAYKCGLHRSFIGSVERGERNISVLNLRQLAKVLRVGLGQLVDGK